MAVHTTTLPQVSLHVPPEKFYLQLCSISAPVLLGFVDRVQSDAMVQISLQQLLCHTLASEQESAREEHPGIKVCVCVGGG